MTMPGPSEAHAPVSFWRDGEGVRDWLFTTDHKRIGVMFFFAVVFALMLGGSFALLLRLELLTPDHTFLDANAYNRLFTHHGIVMVWMFLIPSIPNTFGNFFLPIMIGAKDMAFPKLNLASFYVYLLGSAFTLVALILGGVDTGWTFYVPYSSVSLSAIGWVATGIFILGVSTIMSGLNFIVTTHALRAKGLGWMQLPLFVWTIYGTALIQVLATPVLGLSLALVGLDNVLALGLFDPSVGGDPLLYQHLFWFYSHPAVYIMILPSMGVIAEVVSTFSKNPSSNYRLIVISTFGIALVGFLTWGHHLFVAGVSAFNVGFFGVLSMLVAIFSAIKVFTWTATLRGGHVTFRTPLLYFFGFVFLFVFGGMSGVALATSSLDVHWHDTYFVVGHFHFIMVGGALTGFLAAIHYWFPKVVGRMYPERLGVASAALVVLGFVCTFAPHFLLGNGGMPRRYYSYPARFAWLHVLSTSGAGILAVGLSITLAYLIYAVFRGSPAGANPWHSESFEWRVPSPPPRENFVDDPHWERGAYDYSVEEV